MHVRRRELKRAHPTPIARTVLLPCLNEVVQRCAVQSTEKVDAGNIRDTVPMGTVGAQRYIWVQQRHSGYTCTNIRDTVQGTHMMQC